MKISTKGEYGLRAMLYLATYGIGRSVPSREIADHQGIPATYLRRILPELVRSHLVVAHRGAHGGYALARSTHMISVKDILLSLEGQTSSVEDILALPCTIAVGPRRCAIRHFLLRVKTVLDDLLTQVTLANLAADQRQLLELASSDAPRLPVVGGRHP